MSFCYYALTSSLVAIPMASDGLESDFLEFNSGMRATIGVADKSAHLII